MMSFMIAAIFLTSDEPTDWLSPSSADDCWADDDRDVVDPDEGLREGAATERFDTLVEERRVGSSRLQLLGTLTAHRLW